jgi:ERCC4-type nuclease
MKIQIDFREKDLISKICNYEDVNTETLSLPVGDIIICKEQNETEFIIERKTIADLSASIKDGRFREQKQRLLDSIKDESKIVYIIEGEWNTKLLPKNIIDGAILNLMFIHNYKVIRTYNLDNTIEMISLMYKKIESNKISKERENGMCVQLISKKDKDKTKVFENQLCMINGVSLKIADAIKKQYTSMFCLIEEYMKKETEKEKEMLLVDLVITDKRKIGKALSKKIYMSFKNLEEEVVK